MSWARGTRPMLIILLSHRSRALYNPKANKMLPSLESEIKTTTLHVFKTYISWYL